MLGVGLWGGAKGNSYMDKGHTKGASLYFGHMSSFSKNTCELDIVLTRTINILTTNKLVKLTML